VIPISHLDRAIGKLQPRLPPGSLGRARTITNAPHGKLCANCPLTWVVARFGSFNCMFYQYLVPFPPRSRRRAGNPVKDA
jgi:hypothetical protein